ncbi:Protein of unknown function [Pyronema omphalodes CBS 100304]|uniref:Uncharacterized protein n=1 Tax=Pyronema omphalodes (strain CBS 100304) TaxID=1076935 RepID=U4KYU6_PYROM|nr:Protein of unknown function [Pyronema omphalodes CBS 100304]
MYQLVSTFFQMIPPLFSNFQIFKIWFSLLGVTWFLFYGCFFLGILEYFNLFKP